MAQLEFGEAPDFELKDGNGRSWRLAGATSHKPLVLVFYHSECPTCEFAMPWIQEIYGRGSGQIWGISQDDPETTRAFVRQTGLGFDVLIDDEPYAVSSAYGIEFVPAIFIVEENGRIAWSDYGFSRQTFDRIAAAVGSPKTPWRDDVPVRRPGCRSKN
jgi:peroxiredoxin